MRQQVVLGREGLVEGGEHRPIARLVEIELHAHLAAFSLQLHQGSGRGERHHHPILLHVADGGGEGEVVEPSAEVGGEKTDGATRLEVVLHLLVLRATHLHDQLIQGVVIASPRAEGIPAKSLLDTSLQSRAFRLLLILRLLIGIFLLQQRLLPQQVGDGRCVVVLFHFVRETTK